MRDSTCGKSTQQDVTDPWDKSVERQIENAKAFAASKGWTVAEGQIYVDDAVSGAETAKLREKQRMLALIRSGSAPFEILVTQSNDRLSRRDGDDALRELKDIDRAGIEIWFYADGQRFEYGTFETNTMGFLRANSRPSSAG